MRSLAFVASALLLSTPAVLAKGKGNNSSTNSAASSATTALSSATSASSAAVAASSATSAPAAASSAAAATTSSTTTNVCQGPDGGNYTIANPKSLLTDLSCDTVNKWGTQYYPKQDQIASPPTSTSNPWYAQFQAWTSTYTAAVAASQIPSLPVATIHGNNAPTYPNGPTNSDPKNSTFCAWSFNNCINSETDIWQAPAGIWGLTFDDGPQPNSTVLYNFLDEKVQPATHFMIGSRIVQFPAKALQAFNQGQHICVHTYSHHYMTTLTDSQVLAELGWTVTLMQDLFGVTPNCWRPPYGDVDNRVRAIAKYVFNMTTVIWNEDTDDWCLVDTSNDPTTAKTTCPGTTYSTVTTNLTNWAANPTKYVGANYGPLVLEHELSYASIEAFINSYPNIMASLKVQDVAQLSGMTYYQEGTPSFAQALAAGENPASAASSAVVVATSAAAAAAAATSNVVASAVTANLVASASSDPSLSTPSSSASSSTSTKSSGAISSRSQATSGLISLAVLALSISLVC